MRAVLLALLSLPLVAQSSRPFALVIHGGAGTILREKTSPEKDKACRAGLEAALKAGYAILEKGGTALDATEAAVRTLEADPLFNAGKGAVMTADGQHELDASIMDGRTLAAGAVAGVKRIQSPIGLARRVMEKSPHVMLAGEGAEAFAKEQGIPFVPNTFFRTEERWQAFQKAANKKPQEPKGTVGAVALDQQGNLAAATSTGGMMMKRWGRVGDSPIIGAGTYADNATCAVSCTGWGEYFIRVSVAHDIAAQMAYGKVELAPAAAATLKKVADLGGDGGLIAVDRQGQVAMPFNTRGMFRAFKKSDGSSSIKLYGDE